MQFIKQFREFGLQNSINPLPGDAQVFYYNLLQVFNIALWPEKLIIRTQTLENSCQMTRKRLTTARNVLIQRGLIKYDQAKQASGSPTYRLMPLYETQEETHRGTQKGTKAANGVSIGNTGGYTQGNEKGTQAGTEREHLYRQEKDKTDLPLTDVRGAPEISPDDQTEGEKAKGPVIAQQEERKNGSAAKKKEEDTVPHWKELVDVWFAFYEERKKLKPTFASKEGKLLKQILGKLEGRALAQGKKWTAELAAERFKAFLTAAYSDVWLSNNLLLDNLNKQYDIIISYAINGNKQPTQAAKPAGEFGTLEELMSLKRTGATGGDDGGEFTPAEVVTE